MPTRQTKQLPHASINNFSGTSKVGTTVLSPCRRMNVWSSVVGRSRSWGHNTPPEGKRENANIVVNIVKRLKLCFWIFSLIYGCVESFFSLIFHTQQFWSEVSDPERNDKLSPYWKVVHFYLLQFASSLFLVVKHFNAATFCWFCLSIQALTLLTVRWCEC